MADNVTAKITGLDEVKRNLEKIGQDLSSKVLRHSLQAGVNVLGVAVQERTPKNTGLLAASVGTVVSLSAKEGGGVAVVGFGDQGHVARLVEFGHRMVTHAGKTVGQVPMHPFIRPAFDASAPAAVEAFTETMRSEVAAMKPAVKP
jgi:HK97 gp10 family phage protein